VRARAVLSPPITHHYVGANGIAHRVIHEQPARVNALIRGFIDA
jgi:hypothetical protein